PAAMLLQRLGHLQPCGVVGAVFALVVAEVGAQMLDVEARLVVRMKARDERVQPCLARHQHDLALERAGAIHCALRASASPGAAAASSDSSSSGDTFSCPMRSARSAMPPKACAMSWPGAMPAAASACTIFVSAFSSAVITAATLCASASASVRVFCAFRSTK